MRMSAIEKSMGTAVDEHHAGTLLRPIAQHVETAVRKGAGRLSRGVLWQTPDDSNTLRAEEPGDFR